MSNYKVKSVKYNSIMNFIRVLLTIVFPLITYPYATRVLHTEGMGQASYVLSVISYFQLIAAFGVNNYAITEGAKLRDDKTKLNKFVSEMLLINILFTVLSYILFAIILFIPQFENYRMLLVIGSTSILFTTIGISWLYELLEEYDYVTFQALVFQIISLVVLFVAVRDKGDVAWYVALTALATAGSGIMNFVHSRKYVKFFQTKILLKDLRPHMKGMTYMFGVSIASVIYLNSDITMIGLMRNDHEVGLYSAATKTNQVLSTLIKSLSTVIMPRLAYYLEKKLYEEYNVLLKNAFKIMMILIVPSIVGMILISPEVIRIVAGDDFLPAATASRILALNLFFSPVNGFIAYQIFMPRGKQNIIFWATWGGAITNLIVNGILIPIMGYNGAAISTVLSEGMVMVVCLILGKDLIPKTGLLQGVWKYVVACIPMIAAYFYLQTIEFAHYLIYTFVLIIIGVVTYGLLLLLLREEMVVQELKNIILKVRKK